MDSSDQDNALLLEKTTTLVYESAVTARRKRMEIRRFKRVTSSLMTPRSSNSVQQGVFKRSRPIRTSSICSLCFHGTDGEEDSENFSMTKLSDKQSLPFTTKLLAEIKVPHYSEGDVIRGSLLGRSKSFPLECMHTSRCTFHITNVSHDHVSMNVEGHFMTAIGDEHGSTEKDALLESRSWTSEVSTGSKDPNQFSSLLVEIPSSGMKESLPEAAKQASENMKVDVEVRKGDPKSDVEVRFSGDKIAELNAQMVDPGDSVGASSNITSRDVKALTPSVFSSGSALTDPGRCPLSGKVLVCGRRREMEDTATIVPSFMQIPCSDTLKEFYDLHFFAVYDGHGGSQASNFCAGRFHHTLAKELASSPLSKGVEDDSEWKKVMASCFQKVDKEVGGVCPNGACDEATDNSVACCVDAIAPENVGTTAVVAVLSSSKIVVANCGDSRAVLSRGGAAIPLTKDHKPEMADETSRIEAAGGRVIYWDGYRVSGLLALSRALGDRYLKQYVISEPDVLCLPRTDDDECLILASDGLWDVISNETACDVARRCLAASARRRTEHRRSRVGEDTACASVAALLVKLAYGRGSKDNISVVVINLKHNNM